MSAVKHTSAPWQVWLDGSVRSYDSRDEIQLHITFECDADERVANACLIASAPDLLSALTRLSDWCDRLRLSGQAMSGAEKNAHDLLEKLKGDKQ